MAGVTDNVIVDLNGQQMRGKILGYIEEESKYCVEIMGGIRDGAIVAIAQEDIRGSSECALTDCDRIMVQQWIKEHIKKPLSTIQGVGFCMEKMRQNIFRRPMAESETFEIMNIISGHCNKLTKRMF